MRYFINRKTNGLTMTGDEAEAERLINIGFTEIDEKAYDREYKALWAIVTGTW